MVMGTSLSLPCRWLCPSQSTPEMGPSTGRALQGSGGGCLRAPIYPHCPRPRQQGGSAMRTPNTSRRQESLLGKIMSAGERIGRLHSGRRWSLRAGGWGLSPIKSFLLISVVIPHPSLACRAPVARSPTSSRQQRAAVQLSLPSSLSRAPLCLHNSRAFPSALGSGMPLIRPAGQKLREGGLISINAILGCCGLQQCVGVSKHLQFITGDGSSLLCVTIPVSISIPAA